MPGHSKKNVIQGRPGKRDVGHSDAAALQESQDHGDGLSPVRHDELQVGAVGVHFSDELQAPQGFLGDLDGVVHVVDLQGQDVPGNLPLQPRRGVFCHDPSLVDDRDPVAEHVRLIHVVRGQEDRRAPGRAAA